MPVWAETHICMHEPSSSPSQCRDIYCWWPQRLSINHKQFDIIVHNWTHLTSSYNYMRRNLNLFFLNTDLSFTFIRNQQPTYINCVIKIKFTSVCNHNFHTTAVYIMNWKTWCSATIFWFVCYKEALYLPHNGAHCNCSNTLLLIGSSGNTSPATATCAAKIIFLVPAPHWLLYI